MPEPPIDVEKDPVKPPPMPLPDTDDVKQILQAVIESVLTDPKIDVHDSYGTRGDGKFALDNHSRILWPKAFRPSVAGYALGKRDPNRCLGFEPRLMGIRIDHFGWDGKKADVKEFSIDVAIHNVGGNANGGIGGGCHIYYTAKKKGKQWVVEWTLLECF